MMSQRNGAYERFLTAFAKSHIIQFSIAISSIFLPAFGEVFILPDEFGPIFHTFL